MSFVTLPSGLKIHYDIPNCPDRAHPTLDPAKPTLLFLHPRFVDLYFHHPQFHDARLAAAYNLLGIDHHYHGLTTAEVDDKPYDFWLVARDLLSALDILGVSEAHIFGNSLGAAIAIRVYMLAPKKILSLTLCAKHSPVETDENLEQFRFLRNACYERADDGSDNLPSDVVQAIFYIYFNEDPSADAIVTEWLAATDFRPSNPKLITKIYSSILDREPVSEELWATITCPVLIIHGEEDVSYPPAVAQAHWDAMPNADRELYIVPGAPHFLSWTHPIEVNGRLVAFLDRITGVDSLAAAREHALAKCDH